MKINTNTKRYLESLVSVFQTTDRIVSDVEVVTRTVLSSSDEKQPAGWTDGQTITFNLKSLPISLAKEQQQAAFLAGVNLHELGHVMFSPALKSSLVRRVTMDHGEQGFQILNALEDQRMENFVVARFPIAKHWLRYTLEYYFLLYDLDQILTNGQSFGTFMLTAGRFYLAEDVRRSIEELALLFEDKDRVDAHKRLIQEFTTLVLPRDDQRAYEIVSEIISLKQPSLGSGLSLPKISGSHGKQNWTPSEYDNSIHGEMSADSETGSGRKLSQDSEKEQEELEEQAKAQAQSAQIQTDTPLEGSSGVVRQKIRQAVEKSVSQQEADIAASSTDVGKAVKDFTVQARATMRERQLKSNAISARFRQQPVNEKMKIVADRVSDHLGDLELDISSSWRPHQFYGRVNIGRLLNAQHRPVLDVFDLYDEGAEDQGGIEVVIAVDLSSSMRAKIDHNDSRSDTRILASSRVLWVLRKAFADHHNINVVVLGFSDGPPTAMDDPLNREFFSAYKELGNTFIGSTIEEATQIFASSDKKNGLFITLTDGEFHDSNRAEQWLEAMETLPTPVHKMVFGLGLPENYADKWPLSLFDQVSIISSPDEMIEPIKTAVESVMISAREAAHTRF